MLKAIAVSKMKKEERVLMCDKGGEGLGRRRFQRAAEMKNREIRLVLRQPDSLSRKRLSG